VNTRDSQSGLPRPDLPTRDLPLVALEGVTLFPGTLLPLHAWDPITCRQLSSCLSGERLVVVFGGRLDELVGDHRRAPAIAGLGRAISDRRYPDGRIDVFLHGLARVAVSSVEVTPSGLTANVELAADLAPEPPSPREVPGRHDRSSSPAALSARLIGLALLYTRTAPPEEADALVSVLKSSTDPGLVTNRLAAAFIGPPEARARLLEERCPARRCSLLIDHFAAALLTRADPTASDALH
jgi:Lon protease-like protein